MVRIVAYYANLMLISSFLGLGLGVLLSSRGWRLHRWFPQLLVVAVAFFVACHWVTLPSTAQEMRFFGVTQGAWRYVALVGIFVVNVAVFVPLGERIGLLFSRLPPLQAYAWDLGGSLAGTVAFGVFSFLAFSPLVGLAVVGVLFVLLAPRPARPAATTAFATVLAVVALTTDSQAVWSPYYYITVDTPGGSAGPSRDAPLDVRRLRSMRDPPIYHVRVNQDFYQVHGTLNPSRYTPGTQAAEAAAFLRDHYLLPYALHPNPKRVAVVGAGGGTDVEMALLAGAEEVEAVEIDPQLVEIAGSYNASGAYDDPRVTLTTDDARAFFLRPNDPFDVVLFGFLDSQALTSSMANVRLDGFVYTVESLAMAWALLDDGGLLALSFGVEEGRSWLIQKLFAMVGEATGVEPVLYARGNAFTLCARKSGGLDAPAVIGDFHRLDVATAGLAHATDDWPYLYLSERSIPPDYLLVIGTLMLLSTMALAGFRQRTTGWDEVHFFFLGVGFLLLETKSILDCSLYFGATWLVTTLVVAGVLLMVLLANTVALKLRYTPAIYAGLLVALLLVYLVPSSVVLSWPFVGRLAWTVLAVPLPVFFAGLVFSTTFRDTARPASAFGANLIGATLGGFSEYLGMAMGYRMLGLLVASAYLASFLTRTLASTAAPALIARSVSAPLTPIKKLFME
jgi:hypothetical protein